MGEINQKIIFVTGKGGVGKTTIAAALAFKLAHHKYKTLLIELHDNSQLEPIFNQPISYLPYQWNENLWVACWDGERCLREYLKHYIRLDSLVDLFFNNQIIKSLIQTAPALKEVSILGKATSGLRKVGPSFNYDFIVIDSYATGHFRALLRAPRGLAQAVKLGPMGDQCRQIDQLLQEKKCCRYLLVTLPELLPVLETQDLMSDFNQEWGIQPLIICNKIWPLPGNQMNQDLWQKELQELSFSEGVSFVQFLKDVGQRQGEALQQLQRIQKQETNIPMFFQTRGVDLIKTVAERLEVNDLIS